MLRFVLRLRIPSAIVLGIGLFAGAMLQHNWLQRAPQEAGPLRVLLLTPLIAAAIFTLWVGYLRVVRGAIPEARLERAVRRDAWTMFPLLLTGLSIWRPLDSTRCCLPRAVHRPSIWR